MVGPSSLCQTVAIRGRGELKTPVREQKDQRLGRLDDVVTLVAENPWGTLVTGHAEEGILVSHLPVIVDRDSEGLILSGHLAKSDAQRHELGHHPAVIVIEGVNGYISPAFYVGGPYVPTWNFVVGHFHGVPEVLTSERTYAVLSKTVDHLERGRSTPWTLGSVEQYAKAIAKGVTGFTLRPNRVDTKAKLSQDKPVEDRYSVIACLREDHVHRNTALAYAMERSLGNLGEGA